MRIKFQPISGYAYRIDFISPGINYLTWAYPSLTARRDACVFLIADNNEYADPPSHELRTLIEVGAPWYVVIDKLIEEYPQWQSHFEAAAASERRRMGVA